MCLLFIFSILGDFTGNTLFFSVYIQMFMAGKLLLPPFFKKEVTFGIEDLKYIEEIGRGRFGIVSKMCHEPTNIHMAVKVSGTSMMLFIMIYYDSDNCFFRESG